MRQRRQEMQRPHGREHAALVREARAGVYWLSDDGMVVRVAAPERDEERRRREDPPQPQVRMVVREAPGVVGPVGLALALWMRLFGQAA